MRKLTTLGLAFIATLGTATTAQALTLNDLNKVDLSLGYGVSSTEHYTYPLFQNHFKAQAALDLGNLNTQLNNIWAAAEYTYSVSTHKEIKNDTTDGLPHQVTLQDWNKNNHTFNLSKTVQAESHTFAGKLGYTFSFNTPNVTIQPYVKVGVQHLEVDMEYQGLPENSTLFYPNRAIATEFDDDVTVIKGLSPVYGAGVQLNYGNYGVGVEYTRTHYDLHHEMNSYRQDLNPTGTNAATMSKNTDYLVGYVSYRF